MRHEVLTAIGVKIIVFWDVRTYTLVYDVTFQRNLLPSSTQQGLQHEDQGSMDTHLSNSTASDQ
jgi:hypothetical protein